jgi:predicted nucleic acid-binding protein
LGKVILVDTSVWIDHIRNEIPRLKSMLLTRDVVLHPFVVGEIALGHLKNRQLLLEELAELPKAVLASDTEVLSLVELNKLFGTGIGYVDCHLLASALLSGTSFWTRDKRLLVIASNLNIEGETG